MNRHMQKSRKSAKKSSEPTFEVSCGNVFEDLGFSIEEAANLQIRGLLAMEITNIIEQRGWSQRKAAREMGIAQPRIAEIVRTKVEHYSIDLLVKYLARLGCRISLVVEPRNDMD